MPEPHPLLDKNEEPFVKNGFIKKLINHSPYVPTNQLKTQGILLTP